MVAPYICDLFNDFRNEAPRRLRNYFCFCLHHHGIEWHSGQPVLSICSSVVLVITPRVFCVLNRVSLPLVARLSPCPNLMSFSSILERDHQVFLPGVSLLIFSLILFLCQQGRVACSLMVGLPLHVCQPPHYIRSLNVLGYKLLRHPP